MRARRVWAIVAGVVILGLSGGGIWYALNRTGQPAPAPPAQTAPPSSSNQTPPGSDSTTPPAPQPKTYPVKVYFSKHPESDDDPSRVFAVVRSSPTLGLANFAVGETLKGPTAAEQKQGYFTTVRLRGSTGAQDYRVTIANGTATLQFLKPFDHLGVVADGQASSTLKATLVQFPSVKKVVILNSQGNCEFDLSGMNLCLQ